MNRFLGIIFALFTLLLHTSFVSAQIYTNEKLITVDLGSQTLTAWDAGAKVIGLCCGSTPELIKAMIEQSHIESIQGEGRQSHRSRIVFPE